MAMQRSRAVPVGTILFLALLLGLGCRNNPAATEDTPVALEIRAQTFVTFSGGKIQLSALATLKNGSEKDVTTSAVWSTQPGIAGQVNATGEFSGLLGQTGMETVKAEFQGQVATTTIEVTKHARIFSIAPVSTNVLAGESVQFEAVAMFEDNSREFVTEKVTWNLIPGNTGQIDSHGLLQSVSGRTGVEKVVANFQDQSDTARVAVELELQLEIEMVEIPGGSFVMGDNNGSPDQQPEHAVTISAFLIGKYEVTNAQYAAFLNSAYANNDIFVESDIVFGKRGRFANLAYTIFQGTQEFPDEFIEYHPEAGLEDEIFRVMPGFDNYPVVRMTWYGAMAFCDYYGLRLPTEAEWEFVSRAGQRLEFGTADGTISHDLAN
jgi:formylglycine-generating enzyme required for sulfatase activity